MRFGMHEELGNVAYDTENPFPRPERRSAPGAQLPEETAREIDCAVRGDRRPRLFPQLGDPHRKKLILEDTARDLLSFAKPSTKLTSRPSRPASPKPERQNATNTGAGG